MTNKKAVLVAVDAGSGNVTIAYEENGQWLSLITPSLVHEGHQQSYSNHASATWFTENDNGNEAAYTVVKKGFTDLYDTCDPDYQISAPHRVLVHECLKRAGIVDCDVILGETLPIGQFYSGTGVINQDRINRKVESLKKPVRNYSGDVAPARIRHVEVFPEAVPAILAAQTEFPDLEQAQTILVIDIGRFTCDIAIVDEELVPIKKASFEHGIQKMINRVLVLLQEFEKTSGRSFNAEEIPVGIVDDIIRQGYIGSRMEAAKDKRIDVTSVIDQAAGELASEIWRDVRSLLRNVIALDAVLVVGGGANYLAGRQAGLSDHTADWHDMVIIPAQPELSIARGVFMALMSSEDELRDTIKETATVSDIKSRASDKG